jgi:outer membrane receptor protein involved in Fe transport
MHASLRAIGAIPLLFVTLRRGRRAATIVARRSRGHGGPARRDLRNLPASATVLDRHTLRLAGVQHFQDVLALVPNLNWSAGTSRPRFFQLRGIGELEQWQGAPNPSVGFLIDGIDFSGVGMPATLVGRGRIEVLRGPQGTRYGANALAGLIAVNTRAPRREAEANARLFGDYGTAASTACGGRLAGRAAWRAPAIPSDGFRRDST